MRVLTAKWGSATRVSPETSGVVTGDNEGEEGATASEPRLADKPMFIYVTDGSGTDGFDKIEKVVLDDNKVLVGMKAFKCVKMAPSKYCTACFSGDYPVNVEEPVDKFALEHGQMKMFT